MQRQKGKDKDILQKNICRFGQKRQKHPNHTGNNTGIVNELHCSLPKDSIRKVKVQSREKENLFFQQMKQTSFLHQEFMRNTNQLIEELPISHTRIGIDLHIHFINGIIELFKHIKRNYFTNTRGECKVQL